MKILIFRGGSRIEKKRVLTFIFSSILRKSISFSVYYTKTFFQCVDIVIFIWEAKEGAKS